MPDGFQRSEYLLDHGMVAMVVHRHPLRETLSRVCRLLMKQPAAAAASDETRDEDIAPEPEEAEPALLVDAEEMAGRRAGDAADAGSAKPGSGESGEDQPASPGTG